jgi:hypothetical protein
MEKRGELTRRRFFKSVASTGAAATVFLTDHSGSLDGAVLPAPVDADRQGGGQKKFGSINLESGDLNLALTVEESGITVTRIQNKSTGIEYLVEPSALFELQDTTPAICQTERREFTPAELRVLIGGIAPPPLPPEVSEQQDNRCCSSICSSNQGMVIDGASLDSNQSEINLSGHSQKSPLDFELRIAAAKEDSVILVQLKLTNKGTTKFPLRAVMPALKGLNITGRQGPMWGAIPQEIGTVVPLSKTMQPIGGRPQARIGLPTEMNSMEVVSLYDPAGGGGVFFADVEGDLDRDLAPIEFTLAGQRLSGYWVTDLEPGATAALPTLAIGVHDRGDWHKAVDYYVEQHRPRWHFTEIPAWFRDQGAIYSHAGDTAGAIYLRFGKKSMKAHIGSFENLPILLKEAQSLGANTIYLWDYWEGAIGNEAKGDYIPRRDMGGPEAFREGIRRVHELGGRVITYVEGLIINYCSNIGKRKGTQWAGRDAQGRLYEHYSRNYSMVAPFRPWQDYLAETCVRLVRDYGVDGIFIDSWGYQMNWPMQTDEENVLYSPQQYSQGLLSGVDRIRAAIQAVKPDAVVMGETTAGPLGRHWHGGLSADFMWLKGVNQGRIIASPVRYGVPEINFITNGRNLNELQQVYAAGHNIALSDEDLPSAAHVKRLIEIRQQYKDALIYGRQAYQPETGDPKTAAYSYQGKQHQLMTVVNTSEKQPFEGRLILNSTESNSSWRDLLSDEKFVARGEVLALNLGPQKLRILLRE